MSRRDELRDELQVLLSAARDLSPDTDAYLAEIFVARLEREKPLKARSTLPSVRLGRRFAVAVLALAALVVGGPIAIREYTGSSATSCLLTIARTYPSMSAAHADITTMRTDGYMVTGSYQLGNGHATIDYTPMRGCSH